MQWHNYSYTLVPIFTWSQFCFTNQPPPPEKIHTGHQIVCLDSTPKTERSFRAQNSRHLRRLLGPCGEETNRPNCSLCQYNIFAQLATVSLGSEKRCRCRRWWWQRRCSVALGGGDGGEGWLEYSSVKA